LFNQFLPAALHTHGELLSRNLLPALCRHCLCLYDWNLTDCAGIVPSTKVLIC
jgi:hypothetical protein